MNNMLSAASEITCAVGFGFFLWGLPVPGAIIVGAAILMALYRRRLQNGRG